MFSESTLIYEFRSSLSLKFNYNFLIIASRLKSNN